jgi:hypothetical protein
VAGGLVHPRDDLPHRRGAGRHHCPRREHRRGPRAGRGARVWAAGAAGPRRRRAITTVALVAPLLSRRGDFRCQIPVVCFLFDEDRAEEGFVAQQNGALMICHDGWSHARRPQNRPAR